MGFQFRKSISIGKFFRINLSKSGIGWSVGTKGVRYSHSPGGRSRTTLSVPGTGMSYVLPSKKKQKSESGGKRQKTATQKALPATPVGNAETVYFSATGKCYHYNRSCSGRTYAMCASELEAAQSGKYPCSKCCVPQPEELSEQNEPQAVTVQ